MSIQLTKKETYQQISELRTLICEWDPLDVMDCHVQPSDEYDCLLGKLLSLLKNNASESEISSYLKKEIEEHFGLLPHLFDFKEITNRLCSWFEFGWRHIAEIETIYIALLNEGTEVWRPVKARSIGNELYRIIGVEEDVSDEIWEYQAGAIVKCKRKQFNDGEVGLVAFTQIFTSS